MIKREADFYSHVSEQYHYPDPKPYQKRKVNGQMKFDDVDEAYGKAIIAEERRQNKSYAQKYKAHKQSNQNWQKNTVHYTREELDQIFWDKLVNLGWRIGEDKFVLVCTECDDVLSEMNFTNVTQMAVVNMSSSSVVKKYLDRHKCQSELGPKTKP